mmetsp:Transcript_44647/g.74482  ORF Transcript_44647/g.74482 Transcript_44647/m.74482 type:complete len:80 (+) Transcript_44647:190-429(+)
MRTRCCALLFEQRQADVALKASMVKSVVVPPPKNNQQKRSSTAMQGSVESNQSAKQKKTEKDVWNAARPAGSTRTHVRN